MKLERYSLSGPIEGVTSQHAVMISNGQYTRPLIYLQRPKWIVDDAQWATICSSLSLALPAGYEVTEP